MAKIVVFSDATIDGLSRTYFSKQIVNFAAETANEIYFITHDDGESELSGYHSKVQIMRAFRKWNILEAAKLLPILFQIKADIFHFVQPQKKMGLGHAFPILAAFAKTSNTQNIFSLFDFDPKLSRGLETMILASQYVSVIDPSQAAPLKKRFQSLSIECLPARAYQDLSAQTNFEVTYTEKYIFLPENFHLYDQSQSLISILVDLMQKDSSLNLVCSGSQLDFDLKTRRQILQALDPVASRVKWTGPLNQKKKLSYLRSAQLTLLSGLRFSPHLIHENLGLILAAQTATVMSHRQVQASQIPIQNNVHAKVIEDSQIGPAISELLNSESTRELLRNNLAQLKLIHSEDELGNQLSRMYAKLLS